MMLALVLSIPIWAGEKTIVINRNEGIYEDGTGVYYCSKGGITMTFSSGLNNVNYLVEHQQVVFDIFSTNYVIKKIKFNCLDNTTDDNLDCFYWGPSTISELGAVATYTPTGTYTWSGYIGTWVGGSTPSKYVKFVTEAKPVRFGSVEITIDKEFGDIYDLVTQSSEIAAGQTYALVSKYDSRALGKEEYHGSDAYTTFSSTPVTLLNFDETLNNYMKVKVTDEVALMKLQSSGNSNRPWYIKIGDNYMRRRTGTLSGSGGAANGQGYNLYTESTVQSGREQYFRTNIAIGNNYNALIRFEMFSSETPLGTETFAIRHYNGGDLFRVIDYNTSNNQYANNQRVYLYKPAQTYYVTTNCQPNDNSGYITLGEGVLNDGNGNYTSLQYDNVNFFVGPTEGWGVGAVTVTNLSTNEVTTLTPTATGDFGNDYNFPMPAANVNVTANFLPPVEIDTICNPADGGQFNFINGYTNFSGQYYSNEGKTVTFKPTAAEGYIFQSVTITDNGVTTTMTPDADGVYSFVMPDHEVTLTANFTEAHDLYLLGTANGRTGWIPSGPKFNFDGQKYYLDVYFKGGNDSQQVDPAYGYFSLTKKIDENGIWNNINGYRLGAEYNNYWVENGSSAQLWPDRNDNAFKIPPGVYRIEVNQEMTQISIIEYPLTVTFDPATGTVVDAGDVVNFTSNLNDLVHAINSQEDQATYNSYDNWGATTSDNTHTITHDGITTVTGQSHIGYITATGTADYEIIGDLYLLGTANGGSWAPTGPKFTFDGENYYIDVYFKGGNVGQYDDPAYGYFSLTTQVGNDWNDIKNYRLAAQTNNYGVADGSTGVGLYGGEQYINNAFKIPAGVYRITVNKAKTEMSITEYPLTLTFDPVSGTTVAAGDPVNISSNLDQLVHGINPDEPVHAEITYATSIDGSLPTPDTAGSTVNITAVGATTTVNAQAALGYITVTGNANYNVPAPTVYNITTVVLPENSNAGTITAPSGSEAEQTVTFMVTNNDPAAYTLSLVEVYNSYGALLDVTDNDDGTYTFTMPNDDVTIRTTYLPTQYTVSTSWTPSDGGAIWLNGVNTPQTVSIDNGAAVPFGISTAPGYELVSFTVTNTTTGEEITTTPSGSNEYTFTMPTSNVTVSAVFNELPRYNIRKVYIPELAYSAGCSINVTGNINSAPAGQLIQFNVVTDEQILTFQGVTVTIDDTGETVDIDEVDGMYSFTMPEGHVTITAEFAWVEYNITYTSVPEGSVTFYTGNYNNQSPPPETMHWGDIVTLHMSYDGTKYRLNRLECEGLSTGTLYNLQEYNYYRIHFFMCEDLLVTAYLDPVYSAEIVTSPQMGGTCTFDGGTLTNRLFIEGETARFVVTPNEDYFYLESITVNRKDDGTDTGITLVDEGNGTYSFTMPDYDVIINVNFGSNHVFNITKRCYPEQAGEWADYIPDEATPGEIVISSADAGTNVVYWGLEHMLHNNDAYVDDGRGIRHDDQPVLYYPTHVVIEYGEGDDYHKLIYGVSRPLSHIVHSYQEPNADPYEPDYTLYATAYNLGLGSDGLVMPASDVTMTAYFVPVTTLKAIVGDYGFENGDTVVVADDVVCTWAAESSVWAKDVPRFGMSYSSNYPVIAGDDPMGGDVDGLGNNYWWHHMSTEFYETMRCEIPAQCEGQYFIDYLRDDFERQPKDMPWDESNWIRLDFSKTLKDLETWVLYGYSDKVRNRVREYAEVVIPGMVDISKLDNPYSAYAQYTGRPTYMLHEGPSSSRLFEHNEKPLVGRLVCQGEGSRKGHCTLEFLGPFWELTALDDYLQDDNSWPYYEYNDELTDGYPGYYLDGDPSETNGPWRYNHYTTNNFDSRNISGPNGLTEFMYAQDRNFFVMTPKDQEVAHVWAVYAGHYDAVDNTLFYNEIDDAKEMPMKIKRTDDYYNYAYDNFDVPGVDVFEMYQADLSVEPWVNPYHFTGHFLVNNWRHNHLFDESSGDDLVGVYGRPLLDEPFRLFNGTMLPNALGEAFLFHAAVGRLGVTQEEFDNAEYFEGFEEDPYDYGTRAEVIEEDMFYTPYLVYPLDLSEELLSGWTGVKEVVDVNPASAEIKSIRYYNLMGQESTSPFEGVNIMVTTYKDGHIRSTKFMK